MSIPHMVMSSVCVCVCSKSNWKRTKRRPPGRISNDGKVPLSGRPDRTILSGRLKTSGNHVQTATKY
jgi:hypothetical protein